MCYYCFWSCWAIAQTWAQDGQNASQMKPGGCKSEAWIKFGTKQIKYHKCVLSTMLQLRPGIANTTNLIFLLGTKTRPARWWRKTKQHTSNCPGRILGPDCFLQLYFTEYVWRRCGHFSRAWTSPDWKSCMKYGWTTSLCTWDGTFRCFHRKAGWKYIIWDGTCDSFAWQGGSIYSTFYSTLHIYHILYKISDLVFTHLSPGQSFHTSVPADL